MYMENWIAKLNGFLTLNDRDILKKAGKISHQLAKESAESEYEKYRKNLITEQDQQNMKELEAELKKIQTKKRRNKIDIIHFILPWD